MENLKQINSPIADYKSYQKLCESYSMDDLYHSGDKENDWGRFITSETYYDFICNSETMDIAKVYMLRLKAYAGDLNGVLKELSQMNQLSMVWDADFIFDVIYGLYNLVRDKTFAGRSLSLVFLSKTIIGVKFEDYKGLVAKFGYDLLNSLKEEEITKIKSESEEYDKTSEINSKDVLKIVLSSKLVTNLRSFILNLISMRVFSYETSSSFTKLLGKNDKPCSLFDFIGQMLDTLESLIVFNNERARTGSLIKAIKKSSPMEAYIEATQDLIHQYKSVYIGDDMNYKNSEELNGCISADKYVKQLDSALSDAVILESKYKTTSVFKLRVYTLKQMKRDLKMMIRSKKRRAPMGIIISGPPSIGKSGLLTHVYKLWAEYKKLKYSDDLVYHRSPTSKYWSGYSPLVQPIIHYPELGSTSMSIAKNKGDEAVAEMLLVSDTQPYCPEKAIAEEKGIDYVMPELLVIDCNDPNLNLEVTINNPSAIRRRFLYVDVQLKEEFRSGGNASLDTAKVKELPIEKSMDLWLFKMYKLKPIDIKRSSREDICDKKGKPEFDIYGFSDLLLEEFAKHDVDQNLFARAVSGDIKNYINANSESFRSYIPTKVSYTFFWIMTVLFSVYPYLVILWTFLYVVLKIYSDYTVNKMNVLSYIKFKLIQFYIYFIWAEGYKFYFNSFVDSLNVYVLYLFYRAKNSLGYYDKRVDYYGVRASYGNFWYKLPYAVIVFILALKVSRVIWKGFSIVKTISESDSVMSSGRCTKVNYKDMINSIEYSTGTNYPKAKKKKNTDKDYDKIEQFMPIITGNSKCLNASQEVYNSIKNNEKYIIVYPGVGGSGIRTKGTAICENYIIINKHVLKGKDSFSAELSHSYFATGVVTGVFDSSCWVEFGDDLILLKYPGMQCRDIRYTIPDLADNLKSYYGYFMDKDVIIHHVKNVNVGDDSESYTLRNAFKYDFPDHTVGLCGTPLVAKLGDLTCLVGIHSAGTTGHSSAYSSVISRKDLLEAIDRLSVGNNNITSQGSLRLPSGTTLEETSERSPLMHEDTPGLTILGHISGIPKIMPESSLRLSSIVGEIDNLLGVNVKNEEGEYKYLPPLMRFKRDGDSYIAPYNVWIKKVGVVKKALDPKICREVVSFLSEYLVDSLRKKGIEKLAPYPLSVAQNGYPENFYLRAMKNSTSGGYLFPGNKSDYNFGVTLDFKKDAVEPVYEVQEQVYEIIDAYRKGQSAHCIVGAQLKDEPRAYEKVITGKTRVFAMSSYDITLVNRMYLMPFYSLMCEHNDVFCTKIGVNMLSKEADALYTDLLNFSTLCMEGDYGGYDTSMPIMIGSMANDIVYNVLRSFGYNDEALKVVKGILTDNLFPVLAMENNLFIAPGFQPSGKYATAEDNSLRGLILITYAFAAMCTPIGEGHSHNYVKDYSLKLMFNVIKPVTYGDDMLCSVKRKVGKYFNNITYGEFVQKVYGMEFTNAGKGKHVSIFTPYNEISFLKRTFVYSDYLERYVALLDKESLMKSLMYIMPSRYSDDETLLVETCNSFLREYYFHILVSSKFDSNNFVFLKKRVIDMLMRHTRFTEVDLNSYLCDWEDVFIKN